MLKKQIGSSISFYVFVVGIFILLISPKLLSIGMFMDGQLYAALSKNLAAGLGSFWHLYYSNDRNFVFHGHPPLAMGLESLFFRAFGDSPRVEKAYSVCTFFVVGFLIHQLWITLGLKKKYSWMPLLLWVCTPLVFWAATNNILENTLSIFTTASLLFYLKSREKHFYWYLLLSGLMLSLGFFTKGFVAFFIWSAPFFIELLIDKKPLSKVISSTFLLVLFSLTPLAILFVAEPAAWETIKAYFDTQLVFSFGHVNNVDSRFDILIRCVCELLPAIALVAVGFIVAWRTKIDFGSLKKSGRTFIAFALIGLAGVLPIMVSLKQSGFYILPTFPIFSIAFGSLLFQLTGSKFELINQESISFRAFKWGSILLLLAGITNAYCMRNTFERDEERMKDTFTILEQIPAFTTITIVNEMDTDWGLPIAYERYKNIRLEPIYYGKEHRYFLAPKDFNDRGFLKKYKQVSLSTTLYNLYERK